MTTNWSRRKWMGTLMAACAVSTLPAQAAAPFTAIGVQLYTLRQAFAADPLGTLKRVRDIGFDEVELISFGGLKPEVLRSALEDLGLTAPSGHIGLADWRQRPEAALDDLQKAGATYAVLAWLEEADRKDWAGLAGEMNRWGALASARGMRFAYHNHDFEFTLKDKGEPVFHTLLTQTDPALVAFELDVYWAQFAGHDPLHVLRHHGDRIRLLHLKDMAADRSMTEVGSGTIDFPSVLKAAKAAGVAHVFVERDNPVDAFASVTQSLKALRR